MYQKSYNVRRTISMLVTNTGIVIIMTNPQKSLSNKEFVYIRKTEEKKRR